LEKEIGIEMKSKNILDQAMALKPEERFMIVESLLKSLDQPDLTLEEIWEEEAIKRLNAHRTGKLKSLLMDEIFNK
jgi:putative addiction module component (TIGR02574 family)